MSSIENEIRERCQKLGLSCDKVSTDSLASALRALSCFPMYMVASVDAWTSDRQFRIPILDLPGSEQIREAFVIGKHEGKLDISREHRATLSTLTTHTKASDLIIYEYALETLALLLTFVDPKIGEVIRVAVARMVVAAAQASGEGIGGRGPKVSDHERACIDQIDLSLSLRSVTTAAEVLDAL